MTKEQAVALAKSGWWKDKSHEEIAIFQLYEERLCMPFDVFQEAVEKLLKRPVFTHEFARPDRLKAELFDDRPAPTMAEILDLIPAEKRLVIGL